MHVTIRNAVPEDVEAIERVSYETWLDTYPDGSAGITGGDIEKGFAGRFTNEGLPKRKEKIIAVQRNGGFVVAEIDGEVVGFCSLVRLDNRNQLRSIYVLPRWQHLGIGHKLWEATADVRDAQKDTYVECAAYNDKAIAFYKKLGFKETGRRFAQPFEGVQGKTIPELEMVLKADYLV
jgi:ribosomal protein S18 acetylase RimI-like enzyme